MAITKKQFDDMTATRDYLRVRVDDLSKETREYRAIIEALHVEVHKLRVSNDSLVSEIKKRDAEKMGGQSQAQALWDAKAYKSDNDMLREIVDRKNVAIGELNNHIRNLRAAQATGAAQATAATSGSKQPTDGDQNRAALRIIGEVIKALAK